MTLNDKVRKKITDDIESIVVTDYVSVKEAIKQYIPLLYKLNTSDDINHQIYFKYLIGVIFLDAYKVYIYKQKKLINKNLEIEYLSQISGIKDKDDLLEKILKDPNLFGVLLEASYTFYDSNELTKIILLKTLSPEENKYLHSIANYHLDDIKTYNRLIEPEDILKITKSQKEHYNKFLMINYEEGEAYTLANFIKTLLEIDDKSITSIVNDIIQTDYKVSLFLIDKVANNETIKKHLDVYRSLSVNEIMHLIKTSQDFLVDAIRMYIDYHINNNYNDISLKNITLKEDETSLKLTMN